ncbi:MAG TPA: GGDEF domain-containing protein [Burkholderiaceae bacterium]|nr:GGDEF domain-containing protein [Burkholderiaceae bacterium]
MSRRFRLPRLGTTARLAVGLTGLAISLVLACDLLFGIWPDSAETERQLRRRIAESLSTQVAALVQAGDEKVLDTTLREVVHRNHDIGSIALRRTDGSVLAQRGDHARYWLASADARSTHDHVQVPLLAGTRPWGAVEIAFVPHADGLHAWLTRPSVVLLATLGVVGFLLFYIYLRRALQYLDPTAAVPDRVRKAFDTLSAALLVLDTQGRVMLANRAFRQLHPRADESLHGRHVDELDWLRPPASGAPDTAEAPWTHVLRDGQAQSGIALDIAQPTGPTTRTVVGCAPVVDAAGNVRGCLVTFDDVTAVHRANEELQQALEELERSRAEVEARNVELHQLATRDPLTGCFNRRAFFEKAHALFAEASGNKAGTLCCIMGDIDHFKQFNDRYGHAVGDLVIQAVAGTLSRGLRANDVLCRYGGEEFCVLLPDTPLVQANLIAQRLRTSIMESAAATTRNPEVTAITSSFGLASTAQGIGSVEALIEAADSALYQSKKSGRNRVTLWERTFAAASTMAAASLETTTP